MDGKELRSTIATGAKRGEAVVRAVSHKNQQCAGQNCYSGDKESEIPIVRELVKNTKLGGQKLSFDVLHCQFETLELVVASGGKYLVGVKSNQPELFKLVKKVGTAQSCLWKISECSRGHGRREEREYEFYDLLEIPKNKKWENCQLRTLVKVTRVREGLKSKRVTREESYYLTNEVGNYEELGEAVRNHWRVETDNYVRDVTFKEDELQTGQKTLSRVMAGVRTLGMEVLKRTGCTNKKAQIEEFADNFEFALGFLQKLNFL